MIFLLHFSGIESNQLKRVSSNHLKSFAAPTFVHLWVIPQNQVQFTIYIAYEITYHTTKAVKRMSTFSCKWIVHTTANNTIVQAKQNKLKTVPDNIREQKKHRNGNFVPPIWYTITIHVHEYNLIQSKMNENFNEWKWKIKKKTRA